MHTRRLSTVLALLLSIGTSAWADTFYVDSACGNDLWTGRSAVCAPPDGPKQTIQAALDTALHYDTIVVHPGMYYENIAFNGKVVELRSIDSADPQIVQATVITALGSGSVVTFAGTEWPFAALRGLTITGGNAYRGGGVCGNGTLATIDRCVVDNNVAGSGGGAGIWNCAGTISNCVISRNVAAGAGGGLSSCPGITSDCLITQNRASSGDGGGVATASGMLLNCRIVENAGSHGGGVAGGIGSLIGCTIADNVAVNGGGGFSEFNGTLSNCIITRNRQWAIYDGAVTMVHCTVVANDGAAIYSGGPHTVRNTILAHNYPYNVHLPYDGITFDHSCIEGGVRTMALYSDTVTWCDGNIFLEPGFAFGDDYHLLPGSPCIDAGVDSQVETDYEGRARPLGGGPDIGAYEFPPDAPALAASPPELTLRGTYGQPSSASIVLMLRNAGGANLVWTAESDAPWLRLDPPGGSADGEPAAITIDADLTGLPLGVYPATVVLRADRPDVPTLSIPLRLAVGEHYLVSADGSGDFTSIQPAIAAAPPGTLIEVAPGHYTENLAIDGRWVELCSLAPADPTVVRATVVDGGGGGPVITFSGSEKSETAVRGLTVTNAGSSASGAITVAGSYVTRYARPIIEHCLITRNSCAAVRYMAGTIADCEISNNYATGTEGTVSYCRGTILRCTFSGNTAHVGGGLGNFYGRVADCFFVGNQATAAREAGGALGGCYGDFTDCVFLNNLAHWVGVSPRPCGGAIADCGGVLRDCIVAGNYADDAGGGIDDWRGLIERCVINGNAAISGGGLYNCDAELVNCLITDNRAVADGGGCVNCGTMLHTTLAGNFPNALVVDGDSLSQSAGALGNSVVWDNGQTPIRLAYDALLEVENCDVEGGRAAVSVDDDATLEWGPGNIAADPLFDAIGGRHLGDSSPCLDLGSDAGITEDLDRVPRPLGAGFDLGAYERDPVKSALTVWPAALRFQGFEGFSTVVPAQLLTIAGVGLGTLAWTATTDADWLVIEPSSGMATEEPSTISLQADCAGLAAGTYAAWVWISAPEASNVSRRVAVVLTVSPVRAVCADGNAAYTRIQDAITAAVAGDAVIVCPGTYVENINFGGKRIIVRSTAPEDPAVVAATIIDGGAAGATVTFSGGEGPDTQLSGFTITNGSAANGGGIRGRNTTYDYRTSATISHCVITGNQATGTGTGGGLWRCAGLISKCTIQNNGATAGAGLHDCTGTISDCTIAGNSASYHGGGLYGCSAELRRCVVTQNVAGSGGGGLAQCSGRVLDSLITGNGSASGGGLYNCTGPAINCNVLGNTPSGVSISTGSVSLQNCIVRENRTGQIMVSGGATASITYSNVAGGWAGQGNLDADPQFATLGYWHENGTPEDPNDDFWVDGDYELRPISPCVNAGAWGPQVAQHATDVAGNARVQQCRIDIGAFESPYYVDCNSNGASDACDIRAGVSSDLNATGVPDDCEFLGDLNCDGIVDFGDINAFVLALTNPATYEAMYPDCPLLRRDINGDGACDFGDINPFVALLTGK